MEMRGSGRARRNAPGGPARARSMAQGRAVVTGAAAVAAAGVTSTRRRRLERVAPGAALLFVWGRREAQVERASDDVVLADRARREGDFRRDCDHIRRGIRVLRSSRQEGGAAQQEEGGRRSARARRHRPCGAAVAVLTTMRRAQPGCENARVASTERDSRRATDAAQRAAGSIVTDSTTTFSSGRSRGPRGTSEMRSTTSWPSSTRPNTVYWSVELRAPGLGAARHDEELTARRCRAPARAPWRACRARGASH